MLVIQACNIHTGGGATLLGDLLKACSDENLKTLVFVDRRFRQTNLKPCVEIHSVSNRLLARLKSDWEIYRLSKKNPQVTILFFGNLPPFLPMGSNCFLFFQNVLLLENHLKYSFPLRVVLKLWLEKTWISLGLKNVQCVFVQSLTVKDRFLEKYPDSEVHVFPFAQANQGSKEQISQSSSKIVYDFVYVSSGDPHKNHHRLLAAWSYLAKLGHFPSLVTTVSENYTELVMEIEKLAQSGIKIINKRDLTHESVLDLYKSAKCLIFPSLTESFGLPLLEAKNYHLPIVASERDFVRDVVDPVETFDPESSLSIARAVLRFLKSGELKPQKINTPSDFVKAILSK